MRINIRFVFQLKARWGQMLPRSKAKLGGMWLAGHKIKHPILRVGQRILILLLTAHPAFSWWQLWNFIKGWQLLLKKDFLSVLVSRGPDWP